MKKQHIAIAYPRETRTFEIPAYIVGDIAIHRWTMWGSAKDQEPTTGKAWSATHIPSGLSVDNAMPDRFKDCGAITATRNELAAWAQAWQDKCPEFFDLMRTDTGRELVRSGGESRQIMCDARDRARAAA